MQASVFTDNDRRYMGRALELAERGHGRVSPNPTVGAVIVCGGIVVGEGWHDRLGGPHAEAEAIADAGTRGAEIGGATMYVTLEPCAHHGRQPPCSEAILAAGLGRVVIGTDDPSEKTAGRGPAALREGGVAVDFIDGEEAVAARLAIQPFRKHARTGRPLVTLKAAVTLDGRTATASGDSKWISGDSSRSLVHRWRAVSDAVAVGVGTALADDPLLTARGVGAERQPKRVVFDSELRLPLDGRLVATATEAPLIVIAAPDAPPAGLDRFGNAGIEVISCAGDGADRITAALGELGRRDVTSLLLEGGATLAGGFFDAGEIDELKLFVAPKLVGGAAAMPLLGGEGVPVIAEAREAHRMDWQASGEDLLISARLREW
ncbi:MAG TPA: bifunctional diaminohydroxyphosphoribosylaminopyrimidine deaminase/5-amino-6-(5-phosphoribosylamino)uracil reductase RibD [Solirubrobacterales bacterium]|nr:bifunctional diaminohydroxyphosphoribosylaminopyrimidine deaminase/5-amino-6-(5-phosphoribosylamino)uracil reductase RibD [Solirubrobacterales bacterium]